MGEEDLGGGSKDASEENGRATASVGAGVEGRVEDIGKDI